MRADGKRLKNIEPTQRLAPYFMPRRFDAMNMITLDIPLAPIRQYLGDVRRRGHVVSHMGLIIAAYLRTVAEFPYLNRFVINKRVYARREFAVSMVVLKPENKGETTSKVFFDLNDTLFDVQRKMDRYIAENRAPESANSTDAAMETFLRMPGIMRVGIGFMKWLDKHGW
nr:hypothetical protein [bacterium]